jgi:hypothetical protein
MYSRLEDVYFVAGLGHHLPGVCIHTAQTLLLCNAHKRI